MSGDTSPVPHPRRAVLFVPGDKPRAIEKAAGLGADVLILDLEDAVAPEAKDSARAAAADAMAAWREAGAERVIRMNGTEAGEFAADAAAVAEARPDAVVLPKVESPAGLKRAHARLAASGYYGPLWAMIETPLALIDLRRIGETARDVRLEALVAGTNDLCAMLRCRCDGERSALLPHLAGIVAAARAFALVALDGVFNDFSDPDGLRREAEEGRRLGFDGKTLIHPAQVEIARTAFSPSADELAEARKVVAAFDDPANAGRGAVSVDGRMVERLHLDAARAALAAADQGEDD
ncbi:CoA ester lyase [Marinicauda salina]|uniref:CoA ester lyase n=1 Tax=Marinicauda salina TaxID=2135793 RepID=A0A2U2BW71_9PROT|nr:CoA ester lyase [Marinicauda salina]PWE18266.1 CoA ester lyase [Marinicauda salina]